MNKPLVSVIMPAYNDRKEFLKESIESILNQTYNNIELIIADDSTSVESISIIDEYAMNDKRIIICRREGRKGISVAVNEAIKIANGDFIAHMDADDISLPSRIELQMNALISNDYDAVGGQMMYIDKNGNEKGVLTKFPNDDELIKKGFVDGFAYIHNPTSIVKKHIIEEVGYYEEMWKCAEDYDLWYRLAVLGCKFANVPDVVLKYRCAHGGNDHVRMASIIPKFCCMARLKFYFGISGRLTRDVFNELESIAENHPICRLSIQASNTGSFLSRVIHKLSLGKYIMRMSHSFFTHRRNKYLKQLNFNPN